MIVSKKYLHLFQISKIHQFYNEKLQVSALISVKFLMESNHWVTQTLMNPCLCDSDWRMWCHLVEKFQIFQLLCLWKCFCFQWLSKVFNILSVFQVYLGLRFGPNNCWPVLHNIYQAPLPSSCILSGRYWQKPFQTISRVREFSCKLRVSFSLFRMEQDMSITNGDSPLLPQLTMIIIRTS